MKYQIYFKLIDLRPDPAGELSLHSAQRILAEFRGWLKRRRNGPEKNLRKERNVIREGTSAVGTES